MADKKIVNEWLKKAEEDLGFASQTLSDPKITYYAQICFHFQQAAEKYLKAFIVAQDLEFKKIHDLPELLRICANKDAKLKELSEACEFLTDFYIDTRYPVHWPADTTKEETEKAKASALLIKDRISKLIS